VRGAPAAIAEHPPAKVPRAISDRHRSPANTKHQAVPMILYALLEHNYTHGKTAKRKNLRFE